MSSAAINISVIIPIYQHWELTKVLFSALATQTLPLDKWECFIVDNGSDHVPGQSELPDFITLLECPTPGSYAARNKALEHASGELLVFTDADCKPDSDWLACIWQQYQDSDRQTLIAGGVTVEKFEAGQPNPLEVYDMAMGLPQARYTRRGYAVTANLAIPRTVLKKTGAFDAQRFSGGDAEFCQRAAKHGFPLIYTPQANVRHPARSDWKELTTKLKRVKGGQIRSGPLKRRLKFLIKTFIPPVWLFLYAIQNDKVSPRQKVTVLRIQILLWFIEMGATLRLLANGKIERR